jgi:hypothetical protein
MHRQGLKRRRFASKLMVKHFDRSAGLSSISSLVSYKSLELFYQNFRGLRNKETELLDYVYSMDFDVCCCLRHDAMTGVPIGNFSRKFPYFPI